MRNIILCALILFFTTSVFADSIYLNDGSVIKGKIIQITDGKVEYTPEKDRAFDTLDKSNVVRIVYDDGHVVNFKLDTLYRRDGSAIKVVIIRVTKDEIIYMPEGTSEQKTVPRSEIDRIEFSDGKVVYIPEAKEKIEKMEEIKIEATKPSGRFHDSIVRVAGFFGFGNPYGAIYEKERRVLNLFKPDLISAYDISYFYPSDYHSAQSFMAGGCEIDLMPPAIKFVQHRKFDFTGIKFGVRGKYGYEMIDGIIVDEHSYFDTVENYEQFRGRLMTYHYWAAGPVMYLIFSPRSNVLNFLLNFYVLAGQIFNGRLYPGAALRDATFLLTVLTQQNLLSLSRYVNKTKISGYTIRCGFGPHFSLNKFCPITFGINVTYAYSKLKLGRAPLIYSDGNKKASHHEVGGEISAGFHL